MEPEVAYSIAAFLAFCRVSVAILCLFSSAVPAAASFSPCAKIPFADCSFRLVAFCSSAPVALSPLSAEPLHAASFSYLIRGRRCRRHHRSVGFFSALGRITIVQSSSGSRHPVSSVDRLLSGFPLTFPARRLHRRECEESLSVLCETAALHPDRFDCG